MDGLRTGVWNQCLQIVGDTLRPAEIHRTRKLISFRPVILVGGDNTHEYTRNIYGDHNLPPFVRTPFSAYWFVCDYFFGCAQYLANLENGVHFARSWEKRPEGVKLGHDAAHCPLVYGGTVGCGSEEHLWGSVPGPQRGGETNHTWPS